MSITVPSLINVWNPALTMMEAVQAGAADLQATEWVCTPSVGNATAVTHPLFRSEFGTHYRSGLLAELEDGRFVFGLASYLGQGHQGIAGAIAQKLGAIRMFHWSGELQIHQGTTDGAIPTLRAVNETSGYVRRDDVVLRENPLVHFEALLSDPHPLPFRRDPEIDVVSFDKQHPSLHPLIDHIFGWESPRHGFLNTMMTFGMLLNDYAENQDLSSFHNGLRKYFLAVGMFRAVVASFLLQQDAGSQSIHEACRRLLIWIEKLIKPKAAEAFDASEVLEDLETVESMFRHDNLRGQFDLLLLDPCMVDRIRYAPEIVGAMKMVDGRYGAGSYNQIVSTIWREHDVPESVLVAFMMRSIDNSKRKRPISRNDWTHLTLKPAADRYIYWVHCIDRALESLKQEEVLKLRPRLVACLKETTRSGNLNGLVPNRTIAKWIHDAAES